jgi:hypothetical protein
MRPAENIEKLIKNINIDTNAKTDKEVLGEVVEAFEKSKVKKTSATEQNIWRIIMKSKITKAAAAVVIIGVVFAGVHYLGGSIDGASAAFAVEDVIAAMRKTEWMHITYEFSELNCDPNDEVRIRNNFKEHWTSVNPHREISISRNGSISFHERGVGYSTYDPETNTISVTYGNTLEKWGYKTADNLADIYLGGVSDLEKSGAKVEYSDSVYGKRPAKIINVDYTKESGWQEKITIIADAETLLPKKINIHQKTISGQSGTISMLIDYPHTGPADIYEAGAPKDAEVKIIDDLPKGTE